MSPDVRVQELAAKTLEHTFGVLETAVSRRGIRNPLDHLLESGLRLGEFPAAEIRSRPVSRPTGRAGPRGRYPTPL